MSHPLESLSQARLARWFWVLFIATLVMFAMFRAIDARIMTAPLQAGIVEFELARTAERAQEIVNSWTPTARLWAAFGLGFDYLFMPVYGTLLAAACLWAGRVLAHRKLWGAGLAVPLAWAMWLAMVFDAIENTALLNTLLAAGETLLPAEAGLAYWSALIKFGLIAVGAIYALYGRIGAWARRPVLLKGKKPIRAR